jgi:hypothetical protein
MMSVAALLNDMAQVGAQFLGFGTYARAPNK